MESFRQVGTGILIALISIAVILGGFTLATVEGGGGQTVLPITETVNTSTTSPISPPTIIIPTATVELVVTVTETETIVATLLNVLPTLVPYVTETLPQISTITPEIFVLPTFTSAPTYTESPSPTPSPYVTPIATFVSCGAPAGWIYYYVNAGDTLYSIGVRYGVSVEALQRANCLGSSIVIQVGTSLKVPNVATIEPYKSPTTPPIIIPTSTQFVPTSVPEQPTATPEPPILTPEPPTPTPYSGIG
jgi:LysM repeat protein